MSGAVVGMPSVLASITVGKSDCCVGNANMVVVITGSFVSPPNDGIGRSVVGRAVTGGSFVSPPNDGIGCSVVGRAVAERFS
jgi:hypothetical protein